MPYYQFGTLTDTDASAIVAYLRTVPGVSHTVQAPTAPFDVQPADGRMGSGRPDGSPVRRVRGRTRERQVSRDARLRHVPHRRTPPARRRTSTPPRRSRAARSSPPTVSGASKSVQTSNLTPDATGAHDLERQPGRGRHHHGARTRTASAICGMRALANMTSERRDRHRDLPAGDPRGRQHDHDDLPVAAYRRRKPPAIRAAAFEKDRHVGI